jgi:L-alanine-DL-glutamate epimerase-like enolase superfamily enzyme
MKIGGVPLRDDLHRVESVLSILEPGMTLALDGNGSFDRQKAIAYLEAFAGLPLAWLEEPVHPLDFELLGDIAAFSDLPIATGENLFSFDDARNLLRYGRLRPDRDILQFDVSLSYGIVEYRRILAEAATRDWRHERFAPHAGHLLAMHVVAGLGLGLAEIAMDRTSVFGQVTAGVQVHDGSAILPDAPGVGLQTIPNFDALFSPVLN